MLGILKLSAKINCLASFLSGALVTVAVIMNTFVHRAGEIAEGSMESHGGRVSSHNLSGVGDGDGSIAGPDWLWAKLQAQ